MAPASITPKELTYLDELAADIAANGGLDGLSLEDALAAAHGRRQAFAMEMATCATKRAKMARAALLASVWHGAQVVAAKERLAMQAKNCVRGALLTCESIDSN